MCSSGELRCVGDNIWGRFFKTLEIKNRAARCVYRLIRVNWYSASVYLLCWVDTPQHGSAPTKFTLHRGAVYGQNFIRCHGTRETAPSFTPIRKVWTFLARNAQTVQVVSTAMCKSTELHRLYRRWAPPCASLPKCTDCTDGEHRHVQVYRNAQTVQTVSTAMCKSTEMHRLYRRWAPPRASLPNCTDCTDGEHRHVQVYRTAENLQFKCSSADRNSVSLLVQCGWYRTDWYETHQHTRCSALCVAQKRQNRPFAMWSEVKWSDVKWSEVKWSEVKYHRWCSSNVGRLDYFL